MPTRPAILHPQEYQNVLIFIPGRGNVEYHGAKTFIRILIISPLQIELALVWLRRKLELTFTASGSVCPAAGFDGGGSLAPARALWLGLARIRGGRHAAPPLLRSRQPASVGQNLAGSATPALSASTGSGSSDTAGSCRRLSG